jgi:hypothetical protein
MPRKSDQVVYKLIRADLTALAGRAITDDEVYQFQKALEYSSLSDVISEVAYQVFGSVTPPFDEEGEPNTPF